MKIKVCGITNIDDARLCESLGADAQGFIFYKESKRFVTKQKAKEIIDALNPFTLKVGVFVNESASTINNFIKEIGLNIVQLHGNESLNDVQKINSPVIKAFRVSDTFDYELINQYNNNFIMLDNHDANFIGGTGKKFDWNNIPEKIKSRIILAGGIDLQNLELIFKDIKPFAIDVSSSLENSPGKKDKNKLIEFFKQYNLLRKQYAYNDEP